VLLCGKEPSVYRKAIDGGELHILTRSLFQIRHDDGHCVFVMFEPRDMS
jgi:hypothetical protein